jgi:hypothetical protein
VCASDAVLQNKVQLKALIMCTILESFIIYMFRHKILPSSGSSHTNLKPAKINFEALNALQERLIYNYKNTKNKLFETNGIICYILGRF